MKRNLVIVACLALAGIGYGVAQLWAQGPGQAAPAQVKMAVLNIDAVFAKYEKAVNYKKELDSAIAPFKGEAEKYKKAMTDIQEYLKYDKRERSKDEQYQRALLDYRRKLEDLDRDVRKLIGKKQEDQLIVLYKEVVGATQAYAQANGFHMVFGYGEPFESADNLFTFPNISRKMQGMGLGIVPIWYHGSLDMTEPVIATLNYQYRSAQGLPTKN